MAPEGNFDRIVSAIRNAGFNGAGARWRRKDETTEARIARRLLASTGPALDGAGRSRFCFSASSHARALQRGRRSMAPEGHLLCGRDRPW